ncbi:MAG: hypothetical protein QM709_11860 [Spongiibacteraceae bacterium]
MHVTWKQRLAEHPEYRDFAAWPFIDVQTLAIEQRAGFLRNQTIAAQVLQGRRLQSIAAAIGIDHSTVSRIMKRCLGGEDEDEPPLTEGLIPYRQLASVRRCSPLPSLQAPCGARGALTALLEQLPTVKDGLDKVLRASLSRRADGQNLFPHAFHQEFIRLLLEAQWPRDCYPFTEKSQGYESLRNYLHQRSDELRLSRAKPTRVVRSVTTQLRIYEELQIDEQMFDAKGRIDLVLDEIHEPLRVGRITLACIVDKHSDARLGYQVCLTQHPSQFDLLALLYQLHAPWSPLLLTTPGLTYAPGACLPTALGFPFTHIGPGIVRFDNAMSHTAHSVREFVCERVGATLNLGLIAHPKGRNDIEHAFDLISDQARRLPSATGAHPLDPIREARKHRHTPPHITLRTIEEALSVILTQHNVTAQARLGGRTPLEVLQYNADQGWPRVLSDACVKRLNPFVQRRQVRVLWYKKEKRGPHLNFEHERYTGNALGISAHEKTDVIVEFDSRDIRALTVYSLDGHCLGEVRAPLSWQHYPHSITTRRYIHALSETRRLQAMDPLGGYFAFLLEHRTQEKSALELLRVYREFNTGSISFTAPTLVPSIPLLPPPSPEPPTTNAPARTIPAWSIDLASKGALGQ